ncbi:MAG: RNA polymerase factor sigma-54 [Pyrinomonadaceae bacterium]
MSSLKLTQKLQQRMVLTPQLRQRIEMLQMTTLELSDLIQQELNENPLLEEVETGDEIMELAEKILDQNADGSEREFETDGGPSDGVQQSESETGDSGQLEAGQQNESDSGDGEEGQVSEDPFDEVDLGREFQDYLDPGYKTQEFEFKEDAPSFEQFLSSDETLIEHLTWQLHLQVESEQLRQAGEYIIGNLDEYGRLSLLSEEISLLTGIAVETVEEARAVILRLDPTGCGARDVRECLLVQLEVAGEGESLASTLVSEHLEDMQPHRLQHLARKTGFTVEELDREIAKVRALNPYPGKEYTSEAPIYVSPEVYIEKVDGEYVIYFGDNGSPRLRISQSYNELLHKGDTNKETREFIKNSVRSAVDLLRNIEHRRQTIYRVVECIVRRQSEFLDYGVEYLKPMMLKDVAEDIGMHLSTISRVVNRKYAHTPQGVIELRRFFSEGMLNEDGEEVSTRILKLKIKKMIEEEDSRKPLTDDKIAKLLGSDGVKLSRRTVAKYRDQMKIPGSRERRTVV